MVQKSIKSTFLFLVLLSLQFQIQAQETVIEKDSIVEEIFKVVGQMPRFPGCEDLATEQEKISCSDNKFIMYIYRNIRYPLRAAQNGIQGTAVISFVVEKDGHISDARIVRDLRNDCGKEALMVINKMETDEIIWTPGTQNGEVVRVQYNMPVKFKIDNSSRRKKKRKRN